MSSIKLYWSMIYPFLKVTLIGIVMFFALGLILSIPLCLLWNWLMPVIFGLPTITIPQTFGLSILITLLSPKEIDFVKKVIAKKPESKLDDEMNKKLSKALDNISSQFDA